MSERLSTDPTTGASIRLPSLTGLRFLAALAVFFFHVTLSSSPIPPNDPINPFADQGIADGLETLFSKAGYLGVSFFFVLSGFVIAWSYRPGEAHRAFWRRRLVKIFPNHLVTYTLAMVLFAAVITSPTGYLTNLFLLNSFVPDATVYVAVNPPSWTLCSELLFYLSFPFLFVLVRKVPDRRLWTAAGAMVLGTVLVALVTQTVITDSPTSPITPISTTQFWFGYIFPVPRLFEFCLGAILARLVARGSRLPVPLWGAFVLCGLGYALAMVVPFVYGFVAATIVPVGILIMVAAGRDVDGRGSMFARPRMVWLGDVSFGFYLVQGLTIFYVRRLIGDATFAWPAALAVVLGLFTLTLLAGAALYTFVEKPAMDRFARRRRPAPVPEVAAEALATPTDEHRRTPAVG